MACVLFLAVGAAPTLAEPAFTNTEHYDMTVVFDEDNPCFPVVGEAEVNGVFHQTFNGRNARETSTETGNVVGEGPSGEEVLAHYTFHFGGKFTAKTGIFKGAINLSAHGTYGGEPFVFNLRSTFQDDGQYVMGTDTYNCHEGEGPQSEDFGPFPSGP
jgi:hypothetical protein